MKKKELIKTLEALHNELANADTIDDDARSLLATLTDDIERLSGKENAEQVGPINAQVEDLMRKFETDYPELTRALNQVASALANLGI